MKVWLRREWAWKCGAYDVPLFGALFAVKYREYGEGIIAGRLSASSPSLVARGKPRVLIIKLK